jgi:prevent-host-death family protein
MEHAMAMTAIKKMSALRNYNEILDSVSPGKPVFLTKNGEGRYAIVDLEEYESLKTSLWQRLFSELEMSKIHAERFGWMSEREANSFFDGLTADA